jgi:opacity protein-like surface antigen
MKKYVIVVLLLATMAWAQNTAPAAPDTAKPAPPWTHKLVGSLLGNQVSFTDWKQGGEDAVAWNVLLDGKSVYDAGKNNWTTNYKLGFGQTRLNGNSTRKTDDRIEFESVYTRKLNLYVNPYAAVTFKTQFAPGY